ncbi:hypothetical protein ROA7450_03007 [Roseovarius albus]|uniref:Tat pathway signal sequence domain protein n=1 Tax=Roseovarius albus TaxID=1247867 RepID=A0A1X6ZQG5_9RHOB|nr:hypothetical protein [Roseovarius albus]SLN58158.1 hypothetical protein ROA7450_03007 [Roseovarius albus]
MNQIRMVAGAIITSLTFATAAVAQDTEAVSIELNTVKPGEGSCTLTFLVTNWHGRTIEKAVYETVLFDVEGQVDRLTLFDFGTLPPDRPRVRQFTVSGLACDGLGKVLINGAHTCEASELNDNACETGLILRSRTKIEVIG